MDDKLVKACDGKPISKGGLNLPEMRQLLLARFPDHLEINRLGRKELEALCKQLQRGVVEKVSKDTMRQLNERPSRLTYVKQISGLLSFNQYTYNGTRYYLLGEKHLDSVCIDCNITNECYDVVSFIKYLLNHHVKMDIFGEIKYLNKMKEIEQEKRSSIHGQLSRTIAEFANCFNISKRECPYPWARFHYADVRLTELFYQWTEVLYKYINLQSAGPGDPLLDSGILLLLRSIDIGALFEYIEYILSDARFTTLSELSSAAKTMIGASALITRDGQSRIYKQIINVPEPIRSKLIAFKEKYLDDIYQLRATLDTLRQYVIASDTIDVIIIGSIVTKVVDATMILMDMYLLARMFRSYQSDSEKPKYVVVLVGNAHAVKYRRFFENYLQVMPDFVYENANSAQLCVQTPGLMI